MLDHSTVKTKSKAIRMIDKTRIVFMDSLSVPKIMGTGPIMMAPPPLTLPFPLFTPEKTSKSIAMKEMTKPKKIRVTPTFPRNSSAINTFTLAMNYWK